MERNRGIVVLYYNTLKPKHHLVLKISIIPAIAPESTTVDVFVSVTTDMHF